MELSEVITIAALVVSILGIATNVGLYIHLSTVMHNGFESIDRRLELIQGDLHNLDIRVTKVEEKIK